MVCVNVYMHSIHGPNPATQNRFGWYYITRLCYELSSFSRLHLSMNMKLNFGEISLSFEGLDFLIATDAF